jgi:hypothetical protein
MFCTSEVVSSVPAAAVDPVDPPPMPGIAAMLKPPDAVGVGVVLLDDPPQPDMPTIAPMDTAPTRSDVVFIESSVFSTSAPSALNRRR